MNKNSWAAQKQLQIMVYSTLPSLQYNLVLVFTLSGIFYCSERVKHGYVEWNKKVVTVDMATTSRQLIWNNFSINGLDSNTTFISPGTNLFYQILQH